MEHLLPRLPRTPTQFSREHAEFSECESERLAAGTLSRADQHFEYYNNNNPVKQTNTTLYKKGGMRG